MEVMVGTVAGLMVAHTLEVAVWAWPMRSSAWHLDSDLLYFALVNYSTLGYGDITPVKDGG